MQQSKLHQTIEGRKIISGWLNDQSIKTPNNEIVYNSYLNNAFLYTLLADKYEKGEILQEEKEFLANLQYKRCFVVIKEKEIQNYLFTVDDYKKEYLSEKKGSLIGKTVYRKVRFVNNSIVQVQKKKKENEIDSIKELSQPSHWKLEFKYNENKQSWNKDPNIAQFNAKINVNFNQRKPINIYIESQQEAYIIYNYLIISKMKKSKLNLFSQSKSLFNKYQRIYNDQLFQNITNLSISQIASLISKYASKLQPQPPPQQEVKQIEQEIIVNQEELKEDIEESVIEPKLNSRQIEALNYLSELDYRITANFFALVINQIIKKQKLEFEIEQQKQKLKEKQAFFYNKIPQYSHTSQIIKKFFQYYLESASFVDQSHKIKDISIYVKIKSIQLSIHSNMLKPQLNISLISKKPNNILRPFPQRMVDNEQIKLHKDQEIYYQKNYSSSIYSIVSEDVYQWNLSKMNQSLQNSQTNQSNEKDYDFCLTGCSQIDCLDFQLIDSAQIVENKYYEARSMQLSDFIGPQLAPKNIWLCLTQDKRKSTIPTYVNIQLFFKNQQKRESDIIDQLSYQRALYTATITTGTDYYFPDPVYLDVVESPYIQPEYLVIILNCIEEAEPISKSDIQLLTQIYQSSTASQGQFESDNLSINILLYNKFSEFISKALTRMSESYQIIAEINDELPQLKKSISGIISMYDLLKLINSIAQKSIQFKIIEMLRNLCKAGFPHYIREAFWNCLLVANIYMQTEQQFLQSIGIQVYSVDDIYNIYKNMKKEKVITEIFFEHNLSEELTLKIQQVYISIQNWIISHNYTLIEQDDIQQIIKKMVLFREYQFYHKQDKLMEQNSDKDVNTSKNDEVMIFILTSQFLEKLNVTINLLELKKTILIFNRLFNETLPEFFAKVIKICPDGEYFFARHFRTLFSRIFSSEYLYRVWDFLILENNTDQSIKDKIQLTLCTVILTLLQKVNSKHQYFKQEADLIFAIKIEAQLIGNPKKFMSDLYTHYIKIQKIYLQKEKQMAITLQDCNVLIDSKVINNQVLPQQKKIQLLEHLSQKPHQQNQDDYQSIIKLDESNIKLAQRDSQTSFLSQKSDFDTTSYYSDEIEISDSKLNQYAFTSNDGGEIFKSFKNQVKEIETFEFSQHKLNDLKNISQNAYSEKAKDLIKKSTNKLQQYNNLFDLLNSENQKIQQYLNDQQALIKKKLELIESYKNNNNAQMNPLQKVKEIDKFRKLIHFHEISIQRYNNNVNTLEIIIHERQSLQKHSPSANLEQLIMQEAKINNQLIEQLNTLQLQYFTSNDQLDAEQYKQIIQVMTEVQKHLDLYKQSTLNPLLSIYIFNIQDKKKQYEQKLIEYQKKVVEIKKQLENNNNTLQQILQKIISIRFENSVTKCKLMQVKIPYNRAINNAILNDCIIKVVKIYEKVLKVREEINTYQIQSEINNSSESFISNKSSNQIQVQMQHQKQLETLLSKAEQVEWETLLLKRIFEKMYVLEHIEKTITKLEKVRQKLQKCTTESNEKEIIDMYEQMNIIGLACNDVQTLTKFAPQLKHFHMKLQNEYEMCLGILYIIDQFYKQKQSDFDQNNVEKVEKLFKDIDIFINQTNDDLNKQQMKIGDYDHRIKEADSNRNTLTAYSAMRKVPQNLRDQIREKMTALKKLEMQICDKINAEIKNALFSIDKIKEAIKSCTLEFQSHVIEEYMQDINIVCKINSDVYYDQDHVKIFEDGEEIVTLLIIIDNCYLEIINIHKSSQQGNNTELNNTFGNIQENYQASQVDKIEDSLKNLDLQLDGFRNGTMLNKLKQEINDFKVRMKQQPQEQKSQEEKPFISLNKNKEPFQVSQAIQNNSYKESKVKMQETNQQLLIMEKKIEEKYQEIQQIVKEIQPNYQDVFYLSETHLLIEDIANDVVEFEETIEQGSNKKIKEYFEIIIGTYESFGPLFRTSEYFKKIERDFLLKNLTTHEDWDTMYQLAQDLIQQNRSELLQIIIKQGLPQYFKETIQYQAKVYLQTFNLMEKIIKYYQNSQQDFQVKIKKINLSSITLYKNEFSEQLHEGVEWVENYPTDLELFNQEVQQQPEDQESSQEIIITSFISKWLDNLQISMEILIEQNFQLLSINDVKKIDLCISQLTENALNQFKQDTRTMTTLIGKDRSDMKAIFFSDILLIIQKIFKFCLQIEINIFLEPLESKYLKIIKEVHKKDQVQLILKELNYIIWSKLSKKFMQFYDKFPNENKINENKQAFVQEVQKFGEYTKQIEKDNVFEHFYIGSFYEVMMKFIN